MNRYSIDDKYSYCLGMSLTVEALKEKPQQLKEIFLSEKAVKNQQLDNLFDLAEKNNIKITYDEKTIEKLSNKENCYCIGVFDKFYSDLSSNDHIVLYGFNDYGELGTVLRSAVSFDYKDIVLVDCDLDYFDPRCIRASMGSIFHCNIVCFDTLNDYLSKYKKQNVYPLVSNSDKYLSDLKLKSPYSLIISQDYYGLDGKLSDGYSLERNSDIEISLSIRSSILLAHAYHLKRSL